tara:strand:- start:81 stop:1334 length:1254 start_codon:yes stop_codon:yes gene_type:complete
MEGKEGIEKVIKAQSLIQSIYLCVVLMLLIGSLFLLSDLKGKLLFHYDVLNDHLYQHLKLKDYYLENGRDLIDVKEYSYPQMGLNATSQVKSWGVYGMFHLRTTKSTFNDDLNSFWKIKSHPNAMYILRTIDKGFALKYKGEVALNGSLMIPENSFNYNKLQAVVGSLSQLFFKGSYVKAPLVLPKLKDKFKIPEVGDEFRFRESEINTSSLINSFQEPTIEILLDNKRLENVQLYGNIIIKSSRVIELDNTTKIDECIIIAPRVVIKKGFKGNVQIQATESIEIEENVKLTAGTTLFLKASGAKGLIQLGQNTVIDGNIILIDDNSQTVTESFSKLVMFKNVQINGDVYCQGVSYLKGVINGHVYTSTVGTLVGNEESLNVISDVEINEPKLENRRGLQMEEVDEASGYSIISKMY